MLTHIRKMGNARNLGYYLALRDMWRQKEETDWVGSVPINVSSRRLFLSMSGEWLTETNAKKVCKVAVTQQLSITHAQQQAQFRYQGFNTFPPEQHDKVMTIG